jgi:hypothetical protein
MKKLQEIDTGNIVDVNEEYIQDALMEGSHVPAPGTKIELIDPMNDEPIWGAAEDATELVRAGYRYEPSFERVARKADELERERYDNFQMKAATALQSGLSEFSFGLSDVALTKLGIVEPETIRAMKRINPEAANLGAAAGFLTPFAGLLAAPLKGGLKAAGGTAKAVWGVKDMVGGTNKAIKAGIKAAGETTPAIQAFENVALAPFRLADIPGKAITKTILGNEIKGKFLPEALEASFRTGSEGLIYQLGHNASYASIYEPEMTGEILTQNLGLTGLLSATFGGLSVAGARALRGTKKVLSEKFVDAFDHVKGRHLKDAPKGKKQEWLSIWGYLDNVGLKDKKIKQIGLKSFRDAKAKTGFKLTAAKEKRARQLFDDQFAVFFTRIDDNMVKNKRDFANFDHIRDAMLEVTEEAGDNIALMVSTLSDTKRGLKAAKIAGINGDNLAKRFQKYIDEFADIDKGQVSFGVPDVPAESAEYVDKLIGYQNRLRAEKMGAFRDFDTLADLYKRRKRVDVWAYTDPLVPKPLKNVFARWRNELDEEIKKILTKTKKGAGKQYQQGKDLFVFGDTMNKSIDKLIKKKGKGKGVAGYVRDEVMGTGAIMTAGAVIGGATGGIPLAITGAVLGGAGKGLASKYGGQFMWDIYSKIEGQQILYLENIGGIIENFFVKPAAKTRPIVMKSFIRRLSNQGEYEAELADLKVNQDQLFDIIYDTQQPLADLAPEIFDKSFDITVKSLAKLEENFPQNNSQSELIRYEKLRTAIFEPTTIYDNLSNGYISLEEVEVLKDIYPRIYQDLMERMFDYYLQKGKAIPYQKRLMLNRMFDVPIEKHMDKKNIQLLQRASASDIAQTLQEAEKPPSRPGTQRTGGVKGLNRRGQGMSQTDKLSQGKVGD